MKPGRHGFYVEVSSHGIFPSLLGPNGFWTVNAAGRLFRMGQTMARQRNSGQSDPNRTRVVGCQGELWPTDDLLQESKKSVAKNPKDGLHSGGSGMKTPDDLSPMRNTAIRDALTKFEELLAQGSPVILMGAGCSKCAGLPLTTELSAQVLASTELSTTSRDILTTIQGMFGGADSAQIEDFLSELVDLLAIADRRAERSAVTTQVVLGKNGYSAKDLRDAVDEIKHAISVVIRKKVDVQVHRDFVSALHRPVRPGKPAPGRITDYLVLNYDTALEDALGLERVPFADGIVGGATGWWNQEAFDREGIEARVLKLHGSIDWLEVADDPLPRRVAPSVDGAISGERRILIWPASTKYRETQRDPYAQLAERARRAMRPNRGSQRVLLICGYSFGDSHINLEMDRALRESSGDLTVVAFTSTDEPLGKLREWLDDEAIREQVLVFANRGFFHGNQSIKSEVDLVWWKFENLARLLGGER